MNWRQLGPILASLLGIGVLCAMAGGAVGYRLGRDAVRARANPETWHAHATRRFDAIVKPTPEQSRRVDAHLTATLSELREIRNDTITRTAAAVDRLVAKVESELTPEQRVAFESLKPRRGEVGLEVLSEPH